MRTANGNRIESLLNGHHGEGSAIAAPDIARELGIGDDGREVRKIIAAEFKEWVRPGVVLCSIPGKGFFFATEAEQIQRKQFCLLALKLEAASKVAHYQEAMRLAGFGGLITDRIPETFTNASQPAAEDRHAHAK